MSIAFTSKQISEVDANQTLQNSFNLVDYSITTNGFLVGKVGNKITFTVSTTSVTGDTVTIAFLDGSIPLYAYKLIYTDATQATILSAERVS